MEDSSYPPNGPQGTFSWWAEAGREFARLLDGQRELERAREGNVPPGEFDAEFKRLVLPRLEKACLAHAMLAADGIEDYRKAVGVVMALAMRLGAGYLTAPVFADLEAWAQLRIADTLARECER